ncbi:4-hydroxyphenylacetate 3-monooxygenase, oxygenase component [Microbacterium immunditiarum]|uniref:4-hydroxyphenylacetate 3-monooxygenase n=1 Tax=Microbacterium immunditiarum TaxID=337480 RepID=A0A7Y9GR96_9MICO|nr:4-hydroxyphenylacetate 3-monooxygenase, oxygenase component [Microbacterium immunditiarum]NYE21151.1 4-hydroxyphenylacetate 3-monooxygenase [Microbacterium immunditiarum]
MGARTGRQYLDRLDASTPTLHIEGETVTSRVSQHPAFRDNARTYAKLFDLQHDPTHRDTLTYESPTTGDRVGISFLVPRSEVDLRARREGMTVWARYSNGFLGRTADYLNSALTALSTAKGFFSRADPVFADRIDAYCEYVRENDLLATHTLIPPQVNRALPSARQGDGEVAARIVDERDDGIVVRGARMLATIAPIADELLVFPSTVLRGTPEDAPYSYAFAIPNDTPGLTYFCRAPLYHGGSHFDEPLASRFEEMDAVVVFDDVFVPNERIFLLGHPELCNGFYAETGAAALMTHQVVTRTLAKTEFYLGLASEISDAIGISGFPHVQQDIAELISYVEIEKALLRAAESDGELNDEGVFLPRWEVLNAARNWYPTMVAPRLGEIIRKLSASGLMALPSERDFDGSGGAALNQYLQSATLPAKERARLFKLALDASASGFAGRQAQYEHYFFGDPVRMASALVAGYDRAPLRDRVRALLGRETH